MLTRIVVLTAAATFAGVGLVAASVSAGSSSAAPPAPTTTYRYDVDRPRVLFLGDSYSQGVGASAASMRFTTIVAENRRWVEVNWARGGTGYLAEPRDPEVACGMSACPNYLQILRDVTVRDPRYIVVAGGRNDSEIHPNLVNSAITDFYGDLRERFPHSRIIVISPVWDDRKPPAALSTISLDVSVQARQIGATYLDIGEPLRGNSQLMAADGIHPNDAGHAALAHAVLRALDRAGIVAS